MRLIDIRRIRWSGAVLTVAALLLGALGFAGPADAFPPGAWWYGQLSIAKAQKVSTGKGVTVAVLDTGVQASTGDLRGRVLPGKAFVGGGDARTDLPNPQARYFGHGTAMAGYIAGTGQGAGMVGIAPDAKILPERVAPDSEHLDEHAVQQGIVWAVQHGAKIINVSSAGQSTCPADLQAAVDYAARHDVIIVASTGNSATLDVGFPANCVGAIGVGGLAYSATFRAWSDSTTGPALDFVAPAEHLRQLFLDNTLSKPDAYGTSGAAAMVSGTFALLRSKFPTESARQIVTRALWNVHNGLGGKIFAKRINDQLGYGEILPIYALTQAPPKNATNPIYDAIEKHLRAAAPSSPASASSVTSSGRSSSGTSAGQSSGGSGGFSPVAVLLLVIVVLALVIAIMLAVRGRRARRAPHGMSGPYGPPPSDSHQPY